MNPISLLNRLSRDLDCKSATDLTGEGRLEVMDAINGALQKIDALSPEAAKTATVSVLVNAPATASIGVTNGSATITGTAFVADQYGMTIRIAGDDIDNQIVGPDDLLHPYTGTTGTVTATIYGDAVSIPEPYRSLHGDPVVLETGVTLTNQKINRNYRWVSQINDPLYYWVEANARNRNPSAPGIIRLYPIPSSQCRLQCEMTMAPVRIEFPDMLATGDPLPIRQEYVESYLLPIARGLLTTSELWRNEKSKSAALQAAERAEQKFELRVPQTLATPCNYCETAPGF